MVLSAIRIGLIAVLVVPGVWLLAFGPRGSDRLPRDRVVVEYWEKWTGHEAAAMQEIVDDFNNTVGAEKGIFVRYLSTSSVDQKTLIATAAGVPPDIAGLWDQNVAQFAASDALEPLGERAAAAGINAANYKRVFWDECHYEGKLYALVSSAFDVGMYYRPSMLTKAASALRAANLDPSQPPNTIDELDRYAGILDQHSSDGRLEVAGYMPMEPGWYVNYTCFWFGGNWWDEAHHRFNFTDPKVVDAYKWIQGYSKRLGNAALADFQSGTGNYDSPSNAFLSGTVAMEQQGTFFANVIHTNKPSMMGQWAAAPFPSAVPSLRDVTYCNADVLVIPRGAKHPDQAFEFIAFVNRQEQMERLAKSHGKPSPLAKVSDAFFAENLNPYIKMFDRLAASPNAHPTPSLPILPQAAAELTNFTQRLVLLEVTPEEGLSRLQATLQKKYDDFMEDQRKRHEGVTIQ